MSRGRQKRVEKNHQRRVESKKQKARKEIKSLYKSLVQTQLFPFLDKLGDLNILFSSESLHFWVDTQPLSHKESKDDDFSSDASEEGKQKKRKIPISNGNRTTHHQKKAHPRSSNVSNDVDDSQSTDEEVLLCRSQFFTGQCTGLKSNSSRRKSAGPGSCKNCHYSSDDVTLYQSLAKNSKADVSHHQNEDILQKVSFASALSQIKLDDTADPDPDKVDGIDMLYHIGIDLKIMEANMSVSQLVSRILVTENVPISSIAYVVISSILVFDRFDGGKVFDEEAEEQLLDSWTSNKNDQSDEKQNADDNGAHILSLSGHLFEHILTFLPTKYSGLIPTCCKAFSNEIGTNSPGLWKFLLKRHGWSDDTDSKYGNEEDDVVAFHKQLFVGHYSTCQQVESLSQGVLHISSSESKYDKNQRHMNALFKFGSNQDTGDESIILFWDGNTVLVASRVGCFFRLISVIENGGQSICKEVLGLRILPTPNTKSTKWYLESVALDDRYLVCVYSFTVASTKEYVVTTMMKDQLLTNAMDENITTEGNILRYHDLKVLLFQDALEDKNKKKYERLIDAMTDESARNDLRIELHDNIQPCGHGAFCTVLSVYNVATSNIILSGWLTFSASVGRDFVIEYNNLPFPDTQCSTNYFRKSRIDVTDILIGSEFTNDLYLPSIDRNGKLQNSCHFYRSLNVAREILHSDYKLLNGRKIVTARLNLTEGIVYDTNLPSTVVIYIQDKKAPMESDVAPCSFTLKNLYNRIISMNFLRNQEYLLLLCSRQISSSHYCLDFIVVHVASETEIYCSSIDSTKLYENGEIVPLRIDTNDQGAMAIVVKDFGICITNAEIHNAEDVMDEISQRVKKMKVKKRLVALTGKGGKKQGTGLVKL